MVKTLDKPIQFQYEYGKNLKTTFETQYLAKMIDYGRCHIPSTQEYVDTYHKIYANNVQKRNYEYTLDECGLIHVLYDYSDLNLYKNMFDDKNSPSIEYVIKNLDKIISPQLSLLPPPPPSGGGKKKNKSKTKSKNKLRKSNKKSRKKKRSKKMKGGNIDPDGTLAIFCTQGEERMPMTYTGKNVYISDMVNVIVHEPKNLF